MIPNANSQYALSSYWEERYSQLDSGTDLEIYDWCMSADDVFKNLIPHLQPFRADDPVKILILGCGNSALFQNFKSHFPNSVIFNVDYSHALISSMHRQFNGILIDKPQASVELNSSDLFWVCGDIRDLSCPFPGNHLFDIIIDKATMDVFLCGKNEDIWNPSLGARESIAKELSEVSRLLSKDGIFFYVTFGQPHFRLFLLNPDGKFWRQCLSYEIFPANKEKTGFPFFLYKMLK